MNIRINSRRLNNLSKWGTSASRIQYIFQCGKSENSCKTETALGLDSRWEKLRGKLSSRAKKTFPEWIEFSEKISRFFHDIKKIDIEPQNSHPLARANYFLNYSIWVFHVNFPNFPKGANITRHRRKVKRLSSGKHA